MIMGQYDDDARMMMSGSQDDDDARMQRWMLERCFRTLATVMETALGMTTAVRRK